MSTICAKCGERAFDGTGERTVDERRLARGITLGTLVWDERPRGPKLIDSGRFTDYWVCRSCGADWEEPHATEAV